nr:HAD-IA family hydrolase [Sporolactobacillus pectinivorans]
MLGLSREEWEHYAEDETLYFQRAIGNIKDPRAIIQSIVDKTNACVNEETIDEILKLREKRMEQALIDVDAAILRALSDLKKSGKKLCLISNSDVIDAMHWAESPLSSLFDYVVFSYDVGCLKPQANIYKIALEQMNVTPERCVFVGDGGSEELKGAKELGIKTILTTYLFKRSEKQLNRIKAFADYYIEDFTEIKNIVCNSNE